MIMTDLRQQPRAAGLVLGLIAANLLAWCWALQAFGDSGALMAASLLAWGYGLRHAVDADHIAAIDNVTRSFWRHIIVMRARSRIVLQRIGLHSTGM